MKKIHLLVLLFALTSSLSLAQKTDYSIFKIIDQLKENDALIREHSITFDIKSVDKATKTERRVITFTNDRSGLNTLYIPYDKFRKVDYIQGKIYNAAGKVVRKLKQNEIIDQSAISGFSIYEDDRIKIAELTHTDYPYTVEFEYAVTHKNMRNYPNWSPQFSKYNVAVNQSSYTLSYPKDMDVRYNVKNFEPKMTEKTDDEKQIIEWTINDIPARIAELYAPARADIFPFVRITPSTISIKGYEGDLSTWSSFGDFFYRLNEGRDQASDETKRIVADLTKDLQTDQEKIAVLYKYLQENTRYVSVQLGIGGWQTFDAQYVEKNKYGDCKALSHYMKTLLGAAGIEAYPTLIFSGNKPQKINESYSDDYFNHQILYVTGDEPTWLECTSSYNPPGYLGYSNENRKALLVTPEGGRLVDTPKTLPTTNIGDAKINVTLDEKGGGKVSVQRTQTGWLQSKIRGAKTVMSDKETNEYLQNRLDDLPSFDILKNEILVNENAPECTHNYDIQVRKLATVQGKRMFIRPNVIHQYKSVPDKEAERISPIINHRAYTEKDRVVIAIPAGYKAESLPKKKTIKSDFGNYTMSCEVVGNEMIYSRTFEVKNYEMPPERYQEMYDFFNAVKKSDKAKAVFSTL